MPDRWGQGADYSQQFAYLYDSNLTKLEADARYADQQREEDQSAKDKQVFDRYNAGKMGDGELLAYIRKRIAETGYDKTQQANWREALLQYTESINDGRAAREFERTNDYAGYIAYLRGKVAGMKGNPAKKAELEKQISDLVAARDSGSVSKGADRILLQIQRGKATYKDLLAFYREQLQNTSDPQLRSQIRGQITQIAERVHTDNIENRIGNLDRLLADHKIDNQEYARRLTDIAQQSGYKTTNSARFNQLMNTATQIKNTIVDTGRLEQIDGRLQRGEITATEAERLYYLEAERYKIIDPKAYETMRNLGWEIGHKPVEGQTPLPNPGVLGLPDGTMPSTRGTGSMTSQQTVNRGVNKIFRFITQIDGTEYGQVNCVYTAASMMAYAMGYREPNGVMTGGDLRHLSGDRSIGTNLFEAEAALGKVGITGLRNFNDKHVSFEAFKKKVGQKGMPAVLMGVNNNLPDSLKAFSGAARGHGVFVAAYDPKKDAFLWYDPAVSKNQNPNYNGIWVDADVVKNFGWGPAYSDSTGSWSFSGQALFAPPNTIKGQFSADNVRRPPIKYINVDDAPVRPDTPKRYRGYNHRGPSTVNPAGNKVTDRKGNPRAAENGKWFTDDGDRIDTVEEVQAELAKNGKRFDLIAKLNEAKGRNQDSVTIGGHKYLLNDELFAELDRETLDLYDRDILFAEAAGLTSVINERSDQRFSFLAGAAQRNSIKADAIFNTVIRDAHRDFKIAVEDPDPEVAMNAARVIGGKLRILKGVLNAGTLTDDPLDDLSADPKVGGSIPNLDAIIAAYDLVSEPSDVPLSERMFEINELKDIIGANETVEQRNSKGEVTSVEPGNDLGDLLNSVMVQTDTLARVNRGEAVMYIDGQTGGIGALETVRGVDPITGEETLKPVWPKDKDGNTIEGIWVPVEGKYGVETRLVIPGKTKMGIKLVWGRASDENFQINGSTYAFHQGQPLDGRQLASLPESVIKQMISSGQLVEEPAYINIATMPKVKRNGVLVSGQTFYQDPETKDWWEGTVPVVNFGERHPGLSQYIGAKPDGSFEWDWQPYANAGMTPLPYQGNRAKIQQAADEGIIPVPVNPGRDGTGTIIADDPTYSSRFNSPYDPLSSASYMNMDLSDPVARADRISKAIQSTLDNARIKQDAQDYKDIWGIDQEPVGQAGPSSSFPKITDIVRDAHRAGVIGMTQNQPEPTGDPWNPPESAGPQPSRGDIAPLVDLAGSLGLNISQGQQRRGFNYNQTPPKLAEDIYRPPTPKKGTGAKGTKSSLPRVGGSVMVGGTRIDLPPTQRRPEKDDVYKPPPPPAAQRSQNTKPPTQNSGGAAGASINMLRNRPQQNGMY